MRTRGTAQTRAVVLVLFLTLAGWLTPAPAGAAVTAKGACLISGTVTFAAGQWHIDPGVIDCKGLGWGFERVTGGGSFTGSGAYTVPAGARNCVPWLRDGTVDYWIHTSEQDIHLVEAPVFTPAGAGVFTTPSLRGTFEIVHHEGSCAEPDAGALFLAEVTLLKPPTRA